MIWFRTYFFLEVYFWHVTSKHDELELQRWELEDKTSHGG